MDERCAQKLAKNRRFSTVIAKFLSNAEKRMAEEYLTRQGFSRCAKACKSR